MTPDNFSRREFLGIGAATALALAEAGADLAWSARRRATCMMAGTCWPARSRDPTSP